MRITMLKICGLASLFMLSCSGRENVDRQDRRDRQNLNLENELETPIILPPEKIEIFVEIDEDQSLNLSELTEDLETSGFNLNHDMVFVKEPDIGKLQFDGTQGIWVYQPKADLNGEDSLTLEIDRDRQRFQMIISIQIHPINDAPRIEDLSLRIPEDAEVEIPLPIEDIDDDLWISRLLSMNQGQGQIEERDGQSILRYQAPSNFYGKVEITYESTDGELTSQGQLVLEVLSVDDPVVAHDGAFQTSMNQSFTSQFELSNPDQVEVEFQIVDQPQLGEVFLDHETGDFQYTPRPDHSGMDTFTYQVLRNGEPSNLAVVSVFVKTINRAPVAENLQLICRRDQPCLGKVSGSDPDQHPIRFYLNQGPEFGRVSHWNEKTGEFVYHFDPKNKHITQDSFDFLVRDCFGLPSKSARVTIRLEAPPHLYLEDSFERDSLFGFDNQAQFNWQLFVDDQGKGVQAVIQDCKDQICGKIFAQDPYKLGPMGHLDRSLFFFGRPGPSSHDIYLVSKPIDVKHFRKLDLDFRYLLIDIGDQDKHPHKQADEFMKVEICLEGEIACGLNPLDPKQFKSEKWLTVFRHDGKDINNGFNGRNHTAKDWRDAHVTIDLESYGLAESLGDRKVMIRFHARLQDGFRHHDFYQDIEDAVAIDYVRVNGRSH